MHKNLLLKFFLAKQNIWIFIFAIFIFLFFTWSNNYAGRTTLVENHSIESLLVVNNTPSDEIISIEKSKLQSVSSNTLIISKISANSPIIPSKSKNNLRSSKTFPDTRFDPIITQAARQHQVDPALIKAIIMAESGYNPDALSKKGAQGLMQLMPNTAKWLGVKDSFNPEYNIHGGVKYFKRLLVQFDGDVELALAAYNAGSKRVRQYNGVPPFTATRYYITKVFKYYEYYKGRAI